MNTKYKDTSWAALVSNSLFGWSLQRLYQILLEFVQDVPRKLPLKFHQNRVSLTDILNECYLEVFQILDYSIGREYW